MQRKKASPGFEALRPRGAKAAPPGGGKADGSPRYQQILKTLMDRMERGIYPVGGHIPTESELCEEFDVSRYTVRAALGRLVDYGMVSRRKGIGSLVLAAKSQRAYQQSISSLADLFQLALDTHTAVQSITAIELNEYLAECLGAQPGERWLQVDSIRSTEPGGPPICCTSSFIPERLAWLGDELPGCVGPFHAHIEKRSGEPIVHAVQVIRGEPMPAHIREVYGAPRNAIALCILRQYFSAQGTLIASFNWHPAATFSYRLEIERKR